MGEKVREFELEAKRSSDSSWHPCQVSLRYDGRLSVELEDQESDNIVLDIEDAFTCLRARSVPLQGDDCCSIEQGTHVLAAYEEYSGRLLFDAVVEKVIRVRHSKRASCRCTFLVKWLPLHIEYKTSTIPSESLMKLAAESIKSHPLVAEFLNSTRSSSLSVPSRSHTSMDETESGVDIQGLLEKQIEEIGGLANASQSELLKDTLSGVDLGYAGTQGRTKLIVSGVMNSLLVEVSSGKNHLRRSSRKQNMTPMKAIDLVTSAPSSVEKSVDDRSPLSPLAARAVLASLVSKIPQSIEFVGRESTEHVSVPDYSSQEDVSFGMMNGMPMSRQTEKHADSRHADSVNNMDSFPENRKRASKKKVPTRESHGAKPTEGCSKIDALDDTGGSRSSSKRDNESVQLSSASRLTRSVAKRETITSVGVAESRLVAERVICARVTRSYYEGKGSPVDEGKKASQGNPLKTIRLACSSVKGESETSNVEDKRRAASTRMTRSSARQGTGNVGGKIGEAHQDEPRNEFVHSDCGEKSISLSDAGVPTKRSVSLLLSAKVELDDSNKKKKLDAAGRGQKKAVEGFHTSVDGQSQKKSTSLRNQPLRSSPRLSFLPRTRSQTGS